MGRSSSNCTINDCYSTGIISGREGGGIVGAIPGICTINNCYSTGSITGVDAGGIIGVHAGSFSGNCIINKSYSTGVISGQNSGGLVGGVSAFAGGICSINNSYTLGNISGTGSGGIAGSDGGCTITYCYTSGVLTGSGAGYFFKGDSQQRRQNSYRNVPYSNDNDFNLGVLNNSLGNLPSAVWTIGNAVNVRFDSNDVSFNLPILKAFQQEPWISSSSNVNYYNAANKLAQYAPLLNVPDAPTISVASGNNTLTVTVTPPANNGGSEIVGYKYSIDDGTNYSTDVITLTNNEFNITGLTNGTEYTVRIKAVNSVGDGAASNSIASTPLTVPDAPEISIVPGNNSLTINITPPANNGGTYIFGYKYATSNNGVNYNNFSVIFNSLEIEITPLTNGTPYYVKIVAVNYVGDSSEVVRLGVPLSSEINVPVFTPPTQSDSEFSPDAIANITSIAGSIATVIS